MTLNIVVEIPTGSYYKYEKHGSVLILDRVLRSSYPANYGFIKGTLSEDFDELDVFVLSSTSIVPNSEVKASIFGAFLCTDNGIPDHKLICMLDGDYITTEISDIHKFLNEYKKGFEVHKFVGVDEAFELYKKYKV